MTVGVRITVRRRQEGETLAAWATALSDVRPGMEAAGEVIRTRIKEQLQARVDPWMYRWAPLSPVTIEISNERGRGDSATKLIGVVEIGITEDGALEVKINSRVGVPFHYGATGPVFGKGSKTRPPRPILPIREDGTLDVPDGLKRAIKAAFAQAIKAVASRRRR